MSKKIEKDEFDFAEPHFRFTLGERSHINEKGRRVWTTTCSLCGKECKSNKGFKVECDFPQFWSIGKMCLCKKCANKVKPIWKKADNDIRALEDSMNEEREKNIEANGRFELPEDLGFMLTMALTPNEIKDDE